MSKEGPAKKVNYGVWGTSQVFRRYSCFPREQTTWHLMICPLFTTMTMTITIKMILKGSETKGNVTAVLFSLGCGSAALSSLTLFQKTAKTPPKWSWWLSIVITLFFWSSFLIIINILLLIIIIILTLLKAGHGDCSEDMGSLLRQLPRRRRVTLEMKLN